MRATNPHTVEKLDAARSFEPTSGPLAAGNLRFHNTYNRLVQEQLVQLGETVPVITLIDASLRLLNDGGEQCEEVIPPRYHQLKALSHVAFDVQLTLMSHSSGPLDNTMRVELHEKVAQVENARIALRELPADEQSTSKELLARSQEVLEQVLSNGMVGSARLREYSRAIAPLVLKNGSVAIRLELDRMHGVVSSWRRTMGESKWQSLYVVVCGSHQQRYRDAARQYFDRLLHERTGVAAEREDRVLFAEGIYDMHGALDLLARHIIDQRASSMIFGNKRYLQKDLLANAATEYLKELLPDAG